MLYHFVGSESTIGSIVLDKFGQSVDLPEQLAHEAIRGGCALLPPETFDALGFSPDELVKHSNPGAQVFAPPEFTEKRKLAWIAVSELRAELGRV